MDLEFFGLGEEPPAERELAGELKYEFDLTFGTCAFVWREI